MVTFNNDYEEAGVSLGNMILRCKNYLFSVKDFNIYFSVSIFLFLFFCFYFYVSIFIVE